MTGSVDTNITVFFIPLPQALPLSHGSTFSFGEEGVSGLPDLPMLHSPDTPPFPNMTSGSNFTSLKIWQVKSTMLGFRERIDAAMKVVSAVTPFEPLVDFATSADSPPVDAVITVVEAVSPISSSDPQEVSAALDRAIARIQQISVASGLAAQQSVDLVTREKLPLYIPVCRRNIEASEWLDVFIYPCNNNDLIRHVPASLDEKMLSRLNLFLRASARSEPLYGYLELAAEADAFLYRDGDTRNSVILIAAACEVLLDVLLLALLWESGQTPEEAASLFGRGESITRRVKTRYQHWIGGTWQLDQPGPVQGWFERVADLRNRCLHTGLRPSRDDATSARDSADALRLFIIERLKDSANVKRFPLTANFFLDSKGDMSQYERVMREWTTWCDEVTKLRQQHSLN
jgi:hypothetical protein